MKEKRLNQEDIWQKRDEWFRDFIRLNLPKNQIPPEHEIYRTVRERYLKPPTMQECTSVPLTLQNDTGQDITVSYLKEIEMAMLASIFDAQFALPEQELSRRIKRLREIVKDNSFEEEDYAKAVAADYEYNMTICLQHAMENFNINQINWLKMTWWFAAWALATKTLQELRQYIRWYNPAKIAEIRQFLLSEGQKRVEEMLGKTPTGPTPDYWGFTERLIKEGNLLWERKEKLTQAKLAEQMGITEAALKQQLKRYNIKWKELLDSYYRE